MYIDFHSASSPCSSCSPGINFRVMLLFFFFDASINIQITRTTRFAGSGTARDLRTITIPGQAKQRRPTHVRLESPSPLLETCMYLGIASGKLVVVMEQERGVTYSPSTLTSKILFVHVRFNLHSTLLSITRSVQPKFLGGIPPSASALL